MSNTDIDALRAALAQVSKASKDSGVKVEAAPAPEEMFEEQTEDHTGKLMFSDVFHKPVQIPDFPIEIDTEGYSDWIKNFIPDAPTDYIWPKPNTEIFVFSLLNSMKVRNVGYAGCGKTELGVAVCGKLGIPCLQLSFNAALEVQDFAGKTHIRNGETVFVESDLIRFYREPGARLIQVNELSRGRADVMMFFQSAWESGQYLTLAEKENDNIVRPGDGIMWCATDNTLGLGDDMDKFAAANVLDGSTLDRWQVTLRQGYLPAKDEVYLMQKWFPAMKEPMAKKLVQFANLCRDMYKNGELSLPVSPRHLKAIGECTVAWRNPAHAIRTVIYNAVPEEEQPGIANAYSTVGFASEFGSL